MSAPAPPEPHTPGLLTRLPRSPRKVVIVRANRIGDFLCATPAFRALRAALPDAEITLVGLPFVRDLVARSTALDRFVAFPGFPGMAEQFFDAPKLTAFLERMQAERFDLAIQMHGSGVHSNPFTLLLGAQATAGWVRPGEPPGLLDAALPYPDSGNERERCLSLPRFLGAPDCGSAVDFPLWPGDERAADDLLAGARGPLIGVHPGTWDRIKRWPLERFAEAANALQARHGGTVVVVAGPRDVEAADRVADAIRGPVCDLAGAMGLGPLGAVLDRLAVFLTNDSGPAHIAYARRTPTVVIFGGTDPEQWGPPTGSPARVLAHPVACRPCELPACPIGYPCLDGVIVADVVAAAEAIWGDRGGTAVGDATNAAVAPSAC